MNPRTTLVLFAVAAALGAFVYFWGVRGEESRREAETAEKRLFPGVEDEAIRAIALRTSDGADARVERGEDEAWQLVAPVVFPGDALGLDGMASTLAQIQSESVIETPQAADVYGLGEDARVVRFTVEGESEERGLRIGKKTPVGANSYVSPLGADAVYVVATWRVNAFEKALDDLRERRVLRFDRNAVDRIEASWPGGGVVLEKSGETWRLLEPIAEEADAGTVDDLLSDLSFLRADGFVDVPSPADLAALAKPEFEARLRLAPPAPAASEDAGEGDAEPAEGEPAAAAAPAAPTTLAIVIGQTRDGEQRVARGGGPGAYLIPAARIDDFPRALGPWRFKELAKFVATDAQRFELVFHPANAEGEPTVVRGVHGETGWTTEPIAMAAGRASRLVAELARLEARDVRADAMGREQLAALGLLPPRAAIRVYGAADEAAEGKPPLLASIDLGAGDPAAGLPVRRSDRETVFELPPEAAEHLPASLEAFQSRFVAAEPGEEPDAEAKEEFDEFLEEDFEESELPAPPSP